MSTSTKDASVWCTICAANGTKACPRCFSVSYCSVECEQKDWPTHKLLCRSFLDFLRGSKGPTWKRAILFPVDETSPKFIWLEVTMEQDPTTGARWERIKLGELLGLGDRPLRRPVQRKALRNRCLDHTIVVVHRSDFLIDGSRPNTSINMVTQGAAPFPWKGPVVVFRKEGLSLDHFSFHYGDMTLDDFRRTVDFFLECNKL